jgi:hypothetical protein
MAPNRLAKEKSPYLLQHQHNPVDWFPWGDEAFKKARSENKAIFLSIGYATCHWCHVMEHESFEDPEIAKMMNEAFINIKVDREERPDIDHTYMTVCQLINGHGGWPLSILMNADKEPFFASTYLPKEARFNRIGMRQLIRGAKGMWENEPERVKKAIAQIKKGFSQSQVFKSGPYPGTEAIDLAAAQLLQNFDPQFGGFGSMPKFPSPHNLMFLLRQWHYTRDKRYLDVVTQTLTAMRLGGLWDHVGFGFHRYSTDQKWILPHFEKMLYDQALLMAAYSEAWQITKNPLFEQTVTELATYLERNLMNSGGAFYSAEDADSEGEEGKFYVWSADELRKVLDDNDFAFIETHFGVEDAGNFEEEATRKKNGQNILHLKNMLSVEESRLWNKLRPILFEAREKRIRPLLDDKILTDWNGLVIAAFAKAGAIFQNQEWVQIAKTAHNFLNTHLNSARGFLHRYKDDEAVIPAFCDDYQSIIWAELELYNATFEPTYLQSAINNLERSISLFWDDEQGGFFQSAHSDGEPLGHQKQIFDGAIPSANSMGLLNILKLARITGRTQLAEKAHHLGCLFSHELIRSGSSITMSMMALQFQYHKPAEIVVVDGEKKDSEIPAFLQTQFLPSHICLLKAGKSTLSNIAPFTEVQVPVDGKTAVYVCENYACARPVLNLENLKEILR